MMTPQEVANCTFAKAVMGGYNMASVDDFLDKLTEDYTALYKENAALKAKLKVLADKMEEYRQVEDAMRSTLLTAQKMASSMVSEAEQKRDAIIADAASGAKARLQEIQREVEAEEDRLSTVRADVEQQIQAEQARLATAQEELRTFIDSVRKVCEGQLALLERLPELPAQPAAPAQPPVAEAPAPAEEQDAEPDQVEAVASAIDQALEKDIENAMAALTPAESTIPEPVEPPAEDPDDDLPQGDPFSDELEEDPDATRVLNLDDLQFGRNYTRE